MLHVVILLQKIFSSEKNDAKIIEYDRVILIPFLKVIREFAFFGHSYIVVGNPSDLCKQNKDIIYGSPH